MRLLAAGLQLILSYSHSHINAEYYERDYGCNRIWPNLADSLDLVPKQKFGLSLIIRLYALHCEMANESVRPSLNASLFERFLSDLLFFEFLSLFHY